MFNADLAQTLSRVVAADVTLLVADQAGATAKDRAIFSLQAAARDAPSGRVLAHVAGAADAVFLARRTPVIAGILNTKSIFAATSEAAGAARAASIARLTESAAGNAETVRAAAGQSEIGTAVEVQSTYLGALCALCATAVSERLVAEPAAAIFIRAAR